MTKKPTRAERVAQIRMLHARGLTNREVASHLSLSPNTIRNYLSDPDGRKDAARKRSYGRPCEQCGKLTSGSNGRAKAAKICAVCRESGGHDYKFWTQERVLKEMQHWHRLHGRQPMSHEWNNAEKKGDRRFPFVSVVLREFGSWNKAIEAAGFTPIPPGKKQSWLTQEKEEPPKETEMGNPPKSYKPPKREPYVDPVPGRNRKFDHDEAKRLYDEGALIDALALKFGVSMQAIRFAVIPGEYERARAKTRTRKENVSASGTQV